MMKTMRLAHLLFLFMLMVECLPVSAQTDRSFIRSGNKLYRQQKYAEAETEYLKALGKNPRNTQAMYNLGCALQMQQKDSAAVVQLENAGKAETSKVRKAMAYHNLGVICQSHQMYEQAIEAYKESLRNNPSDNQTRYNLALCKRQQKNQKGGNNNQKQQNKDKNKDKNKSKDKDQQNKDQQNKNQQNKDTNKNQQQQKAEEKMSKDNAEQLLNAAMQEEKATQQRLKQQQQSAQRRRLEKNW